MRRRRPDAREPALSPARQRLAVVDGDNAAGDGVGGGPDQHQEGPRRGPQAFIKPPRGKPFSCFWPPSVGHQAVVDGGLDVAGDPERVHWPCRAAPYSSAQSPRSAWPRRLSNRTVGREARAGRWAGDGGDVEDPPLAPFGDAGRCIRFGRLAGRHEGPAHVHREGRSPSPRREASSASPSPPTPALFTRIDTGPGRRSTSSSAGPMAWASATSSRQRHRLGDVRPRQLARQCLDAGPTRRAVTATAASLAASRRATCAYRPPERPGD